MADCLFQDLVGKAWSWYLYFPKDMQTTLFSLKIAVCKEFGKGSVMESMRLLYKAWWHIPNFHFCFEKILKAYEQVSFLCYDFLQFKNPSFSLEGSIKICKIAHEFNIRVFFLVVELQKIYIHKGIFN